MSTSRDGWNQPGLQRCRPDEDPAYFVQFELDPREKTTFVSVLLPGPGPKCFSERPCGTPEGEPKSDVEIHRSDGIAESSETVPVPETRVARTDSGGRGPAVAPEARAALCTGPLGRSGRCLAIARVRDQRSIFSHQLHVLSKAGGLMYSMKGAPTR